MSCSGELLQRVASTPREELLALVRDLERARDAALLRLVQAPTSRLLTLEDAAALVVLPGRRLRSLARGKAWARRIGRSLRIDEAGLLEWAARCSQDVTNARERYIKAPSDVQGTHDSASNGTLRPLRTIAR